MEYSPPTGYYPDGFPNYGQPYTFSTPPPFQFNACPEILGEGNVTSTISPDGSTQFLFMPTAQWWRPYPNNPNANCYNPYLNNLGVWLIRSIYNPIPQPTGFRPQYQTPCGFLNPRASTSDCCLNLPVPGFTLRFHNDKSTSTSDIHYFFPKQYHWSQKPKECTAVQVDASCGGVLCTKPCNCAPVQRCCCTTKDKGKHKCTCIKKSHSSHSAMSIEESKSDMCCHKKDKSKKSRRLKTSSKTSQTHCNHKKRNCSDKYVTTFAEQASGCVAGKGRETQTSCQSKCLIREVNSEDFICTAEIWKPKTPLSKKTLTISSSGTSGDLCTRCCSSNFTSNSETELQF